MLIGLAIRLMRRRTRLRRNSIYKEGPKMNNIFEPDVHVAPRGTESIACYPTTPIEQLPIPKSIRDAVASVLKNQQEKIKYSTCND